MQKRLIFSIWLLFAPTYYIACNTQKLQKLIVATPVADLRSHPNSVPAGLQAPALSKDLGGQLSQVLFGEKLILNKHDLIDDWVNVSALEQEIITGDNTWIGCPGYVHKNHVISVDSFSRYTIILQDLWTPIYAQKDETNILMSCAIGTMLEAKKVDNMWWQIYLCGQEYGFIKATSGIYEVSDLVTESEIELRNVLVNNAKKFIGCLYVLGGRTPTKQPQDVQQITGIDCSDLINILFKTIGLQVPKNSTSLFYGSKIIKYGKDLLPGDLLFFTSKTDITKMCHVMLYIGKNKNGDDELIEATGQGVSSVQEARDNNIDPKKLAVRKIRFIDYFGVPAEQIEAGKTMYKKRGYFILMGSYFDSPEAIQTLRTKLIMH